MADDARLHRKKEDPHNLNPQDHDGVAAVDPPPSALHAAVQLGDLMRLETNRQLRAAAAAAAARTVALSSDGGSNAVSPTPPPSSPPPHGGGPPAWWATPGFVDALVAGTLVAALLTPVRSQILSRVTTTTRAAATPASSGGRGRGSSTGTASSSSFRIFTDLVVTSIQAVLSASAGLYVGSLQGSRTYLQQLARTLPPSAAAYGTPSPEAMAADTVCESDLVTHWLVAPGPLRSSKEMGHSLGQQFCFAQDPRRQTLEAFAAALEACRNRRRRNRSLDASSNAPPLDRPELS